MNVKSVNDELTVVPVYTLSTPSCEENTHLRRSTHQCGVNNTFCKVR
jgi:hypothetical protein